MPLLHVQAGSADQLQGIADALWKARKVVVITGAGISTNSGIPDFRSENGLYSMIQSQFDAASKLGMSKTELPGAVPDERPRKRRKTTPPMEDSIEVAPDTSAGPASPSSVSSNADQSATNTNIENSIEVAIAHCADESISNDQNSINAVSASGNGETFPLVEAESNDHNSELADVMDDEVVLLSEESVLADEYLLFRVDNGSGGDTGAKEEVPNPLGDVVNKSTTHKDTCDQTAQAAPHTAYHHMSRRSSRRNTPAPQPLSLATNLPERCQTQQSIAAPSTIHSTPTKPTSSSGSGPQTTSSSPLSSPPPAELFDSFNEQLTEPPSSSSRPSSPISTQDDDDDEEVEGPRDEDEDNEPSWSQDYVNRSSSFRRSLSTLKGKELFDASIWSDPLKTSVFYTFATNLRQKSRDADPTGCHQFIGHLSKAGKMVRCYTQNIDLLEDKVGLSTRLLLGAGSRSRFSTKTARGVATGPSAAGSKDPSHNTPQPVLVPSGPCSETSSQPTVSTASTSEGATLPDCPRAPMQLLEDVIIDHRRKSSAERELVEESSEQNRERGGGHELDKVDAQPVDANSSTADKPLAEPHCATPTTPRHDRGVECVFLHGSLRALRCFQCGCVADWEGDRELQTMSGQQPPCPRCEDATNARQERGKRALGVGKLRPDIVLYGEDHPESQQISSIIQHDISLAPDMLIIMGTSLKVHGLKTVVKEFAKTVHNRRDGKVIFVNYTKPAESVWADIIDFWVEMDCDSWVADLKEKKPIIWMPPGSVENEPRTTTAKRRRPPTDDSMNGKKSKQAKVDPPKATDVKPVSKTIEAKPVPKRPAAHRDCKQNAAYWTTKIRGHLASMVGRDVTPVTSAAAPALNRTHETALEISAVATDMTVPTTKVVRRPRTKNTISRTTHETSASSGLPEKKRDVKKGKAQAVPAPVVKVQSKRRSKISGSGTTKKATGGTSHATGAFLAKQDSEAIPDLTVLVEVPVPNSGPALSGEDIPMVSVVKNRTRKPKVHYGDHPLPIAPAPSRPPNAGGARPMARAIPDRREAKAGQLRRTTMPGGNQRDAGGRNWSEVPVLHPIIQSRQQPRAPSPQITLRPLNQPVASPRRASFFDIVLADPPSPGYLEPAIVPPPEPSPKWMSPNHWQREGTRSFRNSESHDVSPKLSPNHWKNKAFSYGNGLFRMTSPLNFDPLRYDVPGNRMTSPLNFDPLRYDVSGNVRHPVGAPQQQRPLGDAAPLLISPFIVPNLAAPVAAPPVPGDSPNRQLQRESEAAVYDQRQFAQI